jgi:hypothetical protein
MIFTLGFLIDTENVSQFPLSSKESIVECEKAVAHLKGGGRKGPFAAWGISQSGKRF